MTIQIDGAGIGNLAFVIQNRPKVFGSGNKNIEAQYLCYNFKGRRNWKVRKTCLKQLIHTLYI